MLTKHDRKSKQKFMEECFRITKQEGKPEAQRIAQCLNMWKQGLKHKKARGCIDCEEMSWDEYQQEFIFNKNGFAAEIEIK